MTDLMYAKLKIQITGTQSSITVFFTFIYMHSFTSLPVSCLYTHTTLNLILVAWWPVNKLKRVYCTQIIDSEGNAM